MVGPGDTLNTCRAWQQEPLALSAAAGSHAASAASGVCSVQQLLPVIVRQDGVFWKRPHSQCLDRQDMAFSQHYNAASGCIGATARVAKATLIDCSVLHSIICCGPHTWMLPLLQPAHNCTPPASVTVKQMPLTKSACCIDGISFLGSFHTNSRLAPVSSHTCSIHRRTTWALHLPAQPAQGSLRDAPAMSGTCGTLTQR